MYLKFVNVWNGYTKPFAYQGMFLTSLVALITRNSSVYAQKESKAAQLSHQIPWVDLVERDPQVL